MSLPYTPSIPATNNDPADDQPLMQQNFASINTLINVDHVGFANAFYGEHNQVTFADNNVVVPPTPLSGSNRQGILFTNTVNSGNVNQLFYYAGTTAQSSSQYLAAASGSTFVLGGIILKWGTYPTAGDNADIVFTSDFPNNCYQVLITVVSASSVNSTIFVTQGQTTTHRFRTNKTGSSNYPISYLAIGN